MTDINKHRQVDQVVHYMNFTIPYTYTHYSHNDLWVPIQLLLQEVIPSELKLSSQDFEHGFSHCWVWGDDFLQFFKTQRSSASSFSSAFLVISPNQYSSADLEGYLLT